MNITGFFNLEKLDLTVQFFSAEVYCLERSYPLVKVLVMNIECVDILTGEHLLSI